MPIYKPGSEQRPDPTLTKFYFERIKKSDQICMKWYQKYGSNFTKPVTFSGDEIGHNEASIQRAIYEAGLDETKRGFMASTQYRRTKHPHDDKPVPLVADMRKTHTIPQLGLGNPEEDPRLARPDSDPTPDPIQKPAPSELRHVIYSGTDLNPLGRKEYLKLRQRIKPEDKFYFPEVSGWEIGWRMKDSVFGRNTTPENRRVAEFTKTTYKSGLKPDPPYYGELIPAGKLIGKPI